ncbi:hypothetical protein SUGI_1133990 [Cryptomeria japonica]|uniref:vicilin-like seed storage protein At2g18540 n=1 Tax=Cryptomeria japonica TaxID=3369 RepID=UPI002414802E|nr:vicilin-like seed storage protein At2g18540 [Cryptomeria japonica]GLJ53208.1 hypothetical protein SUGI_1133990 [Cryptomeria japonica]
MTEKKFCSVDLKLRKAIQAKAKLEQDRLRKLEEKRQKEEERMKNAAEIAANKRKMEETERREREEKRKKRLEKAQKQHKEVEERFRAEMEEKEQRRQALIEYERKRKAMEEEAKKQRRMERVKEVAERRRQIEENAKQMCIKSNQFASKDANYMEEVRQNNETTLDTHATEEAQSILDSDADIDFNNQSSSSYESSEEEANYDDFALGKIIPSWTRKENLIPQIISQQYIDPDEIFAGARTFNLNEVFDSDGSNGTRDFKRRSYSGEWFNDGLTEEEEYLYKLQMGYI